MHSPMDPDSPSSSDSETIDEPRSRNHNLIDESGPAFSVIPSGPSFTKRRGLFGSSSSVRDMKSRRREEFSRRPLGGSGMWERDAPARQKDELVDVQVVEQLRDQFGDPFDDSVVKNAS